MTRCTSFWRKWEEEGNFCGLDPSEVSRIKAYLEFVGKIEKTGIDREFVFQNFSEGAARPLIAIKDDETRLKGVNYVVACLKRKEKVTAGDLQQTLKGWLKDAAKPCSVNARSEKLTIVKNEDQTKPELEKEPQSEKAELPINQVIIQEPPKPKPIPCRDHHPATGKPQFVCPDLANHLVVEKIRGRVCSVSRQPINQLPGSECPIEKAERLKGTASESLHPASEDGFGNKIVKPAPYKIVPVKITKEQFIESFRGYYTPKTVGAADELVKSGVMGEDYAELIDALIWEASGRMEV